MMEKWWWVILLSLIVLNGCQTEVDNSVNCVPAGCSKQLCINEKNAEGLITTCEYKEEYKCLEFSNCGFYNGECEWDETAKYLECLTEVS